MSLGAERQQIRDKVHLQQGGQLQVFVTVLRLPFCTTRQDKRKITEIKKIYRDRRKIEENLQ